MRIKSSKLKLDTKVPTAQDALSDIRFYIISQTQMSFLEARKLNNALIILESFIKANILGGEQRND